MDEMPSDLETFDRYETAGSLGLRPRWQTRIPNEIWNKARSGPAILFGALMLANVVAYSYHMLMARMMSPADYGVVVTLVSISYVLNVLQRTIQAALTKTVATTRDTHVGLVRTVFMAAMRILVPLAIVAFLAHWLASGWVADFFHIGSATPVILLGLYTFSSILLPVPRGILLGLNRLYGASVIAILEPLARLIVGLALVACGLGAIGALTGYAVGIFVAFTIALILLWPQRSPKINHAPRSASFDGLDRYALLVLVINACLMIMSSVDQIAVKHFFSADVAGNYAVAFVLGRVIVMSAISLGVVIFTRSATMRSDDPGHVFLLAKGLLLMGVVAVMATAGFLAAPTMIVELMAGPQYGIAQAYVGLVGIEMTLFGLVYIQAYYHISLQKMQVIWPLCFATIFEIILLARYHATVQQVLMILVSVTGGLLVCVSGLSWWILHTSGRTTPTVVPAPSQSGTDIRKEEMVR